MGTNILTDEQYKMLSKKLINTLEKHYKIIPLNTLKNSHFVLKKPIYITLEKELDVVIASLDDIEAFAYADTEFEAINRLCEEIIYVYLYFKKNKKKICPLTSKNV